MEELLVIELVISNTVSSSCTTKLTDVLLHCISDSVERRLDMFSARVNVLSLYNCTSNSTVLYYLPQESLFSREMESLKGRSAFNDSKMLKVKEAGK